MARFELDMPDHAVGFQDQIIAVAIDLGSKNLDIAGTLAPQTAQQITKE